MPLKSPFAFAKELTSPLIGIREGATTPADNDPEYYGHDSFIYSTKISNALNKARRNPIVTIVVNWITDQASTTPMVMIQTDEDGKPTIERSHELLDLMRKPSEFLSGKELISITIWDMLTSKLAQAFWHKERLVNGTVYALTPLPSARVVVKGDRENLITRYDYYPDKDRSTPVEYPIDEVVHIRLEPDPSDPKNGLSPLISVSKDLLIDDQSEDYISNVLFNQGSPGGLLAPPKDVGPLDEDVAMATRDYIKDEFKGIRRGTLGVLRTFMEFIDTNISPRDMALKGIQDTVVERICGALGVHPVVLGLGAGISQSRVGAATQVFETAAWANRIVPLTDTIAEQVARQLLPDFVSEEQLSEWELRWDRTGVAALQPDMLAEAQRWSLLFRSGIVTRYDALVGQGLEADDTDKVRLIPSGTELVDASAPIEVQTGGDDGETTPTDETPEEEEGAIEQAFGSLFNNDDSHNANLIISASKADLTEEQQDLLIMLAEDAQRLESEYAKRLMDAFEDLGMRAVQAFWTAEGTQAIRNVGIDQKQDGIGEDEILRQVDRILRNMGINLWVQQSALPDISDHYLSVLTTTSESISASIGSTVNIPDPVGRQIVAQGGTRLGLVDFDEQARRSLFAALSEGRAAGEGPLQLAARIQSRVPAGPFPVRGPEYRSLVIARTETKYAQNISTLASYRSAPTVTHVLVVDAQGAGRQDEECLAVDGVRMTFDEADQLGALEHPLCTRSFSPVIAA